MTPDSAQEPSCTSRMASTLGGAVFACADLSLGAFERFWSLLGLILRRESAHGNAGDAGSREQELMPQQEVVLDPNQHGSRVEISRYCASGEGSALSSVDVDQDSAYWEVEVVSPGRFFVGVARPCARRSEILRLSDPLGDGDCSWALSSERFGTEFKPRDTIGVYFDQREMREVRFALNGAMLTDENSIVRGMRGDVRAAISIDQGAILKFRFDENSFRYKPSGSMKRFRAIIPARSVI
mmetsp:Transcript_534/g.1341  ORF Transcript_534/g.1341 Transcript_534/m.1341 type:complete len:240 (-) Transcript_534:2651-3370(-)|eukprot:CAMPEP_0171484654 /NCGR_PEP_ID=MMETSP0958-20121227/119_1 /TAXON_ID=87120 /ORGANISM="Aurantiochytrium limacinum, Strain ATCCMYA-1381" /LENGTH=239 /DNA_ID=CAMNT_0012017375 /DNA_START=91 /DNA_END=810 /DNA_ORIENTATION=+